MTARSDAHTIGYVFAPGKHAHPSRQRLRQPALTKRRAVDFCRVAAALCRTGSARYAGCTVSVCA